jgi:diaminohydroxyphosphoribosylaminopyrimidine deaminase/5-amino-6-(5-phosphoribosylamino)uracil reductase
MNHEHFMQRCLQLAEKGLAYAAPNPLVGCVIVYNSKVVGEGFHALYGGPHAEVMAINSVSDKTVLSKSTLYVTLEPCSHFGKTPPCTDLIIRYKIPEVIIGTKDPFEKVNGSGIKKLKAAGVKVTTGILEKECSFMNRRFFVFHKQKRPYIILKWAESKDRFIAPYKSFQGTQTMALEKQTMPHLISNEYSRMLVHKWRSEEAAIMVGTNTARMDNPKLTVRNMPGKNPVRIVIDKNLTLDGSLHLFDQKVRTLVYTSKKKASKNNLEFVKIDFDGNTIKQVLNHLFAENIQSLIVEGGTHLLHSIMEQNLWDEARVFTSEALLNAGIKAPEINGKIIEKKKIENDTLTVFVS